MTPRIVLSAGNFEAPTAFEISAAQFGASQKHVAPLSASTNVLFSPEQNGYCHSTCNEFENRTQDHLEKFDAKTQRAYTIFRFPPRLLAVPTSERFFLSQNNRN